MEREGRAGDRRERDPQNLPSERHGGDRPAESDPRRLADGEGGMGRAIPSGEPAMESTETGISEPDSSHHCLIYAGGPDSSTRPF